DDEGTAVGGGQAGVGVDELVVLRVAAAQVEDAIARKGDADGDGAEVGNLGGDSHAATVGGGDDQFASARGDKAGGGALTGVGAGVLRVLIADDRRVGVAGVA